MIRVNNDLTGYTLDDYQTLFGRIDGILQKRELLKERYTRFSSDSSMLYGDLAIPFEKFIVDLATGYLAGKPSYDIDILNDTARDIQKRYFEKDAMDEKQIEEMKAIIEYVIRYNDDDQEVYKLIHDYLLYGACYEVLYENEDNNIVYNSFDASNTVAIWSTDIPRNLIAIVSKYTEQDSQNNVYDRFRVVDADSMRIYDRQSDKEIVERTELSEEKKWSDVPGFACESDFSIIENCESLINVYENLLKNVKDTYKYNAEDCKLKINGYKAQNRLMVKDNNGNMVINEDRVKEDEYVLSSRTFYTEEGGDADWLVKPVDANGVTTLLKYYVDSIFQICGIPNTADLAFNSSDLNASAIDRKFYIMNIKTEEIVSDIKKGLLRRFELIFNRLNQKFSTKYDFRYINIDIAKNLPSMEDETIDRMKKLEGIISEQTIVETLGYDYESEKSKKENEVDELQLPGQSSNEDEDGPKQDEEENLESNEGSKSEDDEGETSRE